VLAFKDKEKGKENANKYEAFNGLIKLRDVVQFGLDDRIKHRPQIVLEPN